MNNVDLTPIFRPGFSKPIKIEPDILGEYKDSLDDLVTKLQMEHSSDPEISADRIVVSTTVEQKGNHKLVFENCGNLQQILDSCVNKTATLDDRTLTRIEVLLDAAVTDRLSVVYRENEVASDGKNQELTIMTHHGSNRPPELLQLEDLFGSSSHVTTVKFSDDHRERMGTLKTKMPSRIYQTLNVAQQREGVDTRLDGLKDNPKGSLAEEEVKELREKAGDKIVERLQDDKDKAHHKKVERSLEKEGIIERQIKERREQENKENQIPPTA